MKTSRKILNIIVLALINDISDAQPFSVTATYSDTVYSGYVSTKCSVGGCTYTLAVVIPAGAIVDEIAYSFAYQTVNQCLNDQGSFFVKLGNCQTECQTYKIALPGGCITDNKLGYDSFKDCLPAHSCAVDTLSFVLDFSRSTKPGAGCGLSCVSQNRPWHPLRQICNPLLFKFQTGRLMVCLFYFLQTLFCFAWGKDLSLEKLSNSCHSR